MQYDERKTRPESTRKFLAQQVQEQSDLCDVTLKMSHWEKKFHRCVLVASPFFDHVLKNNFLEKQKGEIEIKLGNPSTLEMAIMFLYGMRPKLNEDNIEHMLHFAEFLLLPNLKSACISWLKNVSITEENCINVLQLSSIFDFEIPDCTEYIEGHMSEMLRQSQMLNLTKDSVELLFSDKRLSYVSMDEKVTFLLRWRDTRPDQRNAYFTELLATIEFHEVSKTMLQELSEDRNLSEIINFEQVLDGTDDESTRQRVLIMKGESGEGSFWCLDLERKRWFRLESRAYEEVLSYRFDDISGKGTGDFDIYFTNRYNRQSEIRTLDLQSDTNKTFKFVDKESGEDLKQFDYLNIAGNTCIVSINERVKTRKQRSQSLQSIRRMGRSLKSYIEYIDTSTLYIGHMVDENIQMSPLLTFKGDMISQFCIGKSLTVAILFKSCKFISLYDLVDHSLERIKLCTDYNDSLAQSEDGFIIYNNERCICLTRQTGPSLSDKYTIKQVSFGGHRFQKNRFFFCGTTWYHFYRDNYNDTSTFESLPHDCVASVNSTENLSWNPLPLPKEDTGYYRETIKLNCFEICLPKFKLRCDIECPHCKVAASTTASRVTYIHDFDDDDDYYEDSPDDNYDGTVYVGYGCRVYYDDYD